MVISCLNVMFRCISNLHTAAYLSVLSHLHLVGCRVESGSCPLVQHSSSPSDALPESLLPPLPGPGRSVREQRKTQQQRVRQVEQHLLGENVLRHSDAPVQVEDRVGSSGGYEERVSWRLQHQLHSLTVPHSLLQLRQDVLEPGERRYLCHVARTRTAQICSLT